MSNLRAFESLVNLQTPYLNKYNIMMECIKESTFYLGSLKYEP